MTNRMKPLCVRGGDTYSAKRSKAGYQLCLSCGEDAAQTQRKSWCIMTPHKQGAMFFTVDSAKELAKGINSKYTPV